MDWQDWLLFLHVGSVFLFGMAFVAFWGAVIVTFRPGDASPETLATALVRPANVIVGIGAFGSLVFGLWLAVDHDAYHPWDGWIVASIVLWVLAVGVGNLAGMSYQRAMRSDTPEAAAGLRRRGLLFQITASAAYIAILVLMIYKPGA